MRFSWPLLLGGLALSFLVSLVLNSLGFPGFIGFGLLPLLFQWRSGSSSAGAGAPYVNTTGPMIASIAIAVIFALLFAIYAPRFFGGMHRSPSYSQSYYSNDYR
jgi:hypothetical protein